MIAFFLIFKFIFLHVPLGEFGDQGFSIRGAKGMRGDVGYPGLDGMNGLKGLIGDDGAPGFPGELSHTISHLSNFHHLSILSERSTW